MKLNFTIELPCKEHENCYGLDIDSINPIIQFTQGENTMTTNSHSQNIQTSSNNHSKITVTETITKRILRRKKISKKESKFNEDEDFKVFIEDVNLEYNELVNKYNLLVDENGKLKMALKNSGGSQGSGAEREKYNLLKKEFEDFKKNLGENGANGKIGLGSHVLNEEVKSLKRELLEREDKIRNFYKKQDRIEQERDGKDDVISNLKNELEEKYEHFEELNKYINDLLKEKKEKVWDLEKKNKEIKELRLQITGQSSSFQTFKKTTGNTTTSKTVKKRRIIKKKKKKASKGLTKEEIDELIKDYNNLLSEYQDHSEKAQDLENRYTYLQTEFKDYKKYNTRNTNNKNEFTDDDYKSLKKRYDNLRRDFEILNNGGKIRNRYSDEDYKSLKKRYDDLRTDFEVLKKGGKISNRYTDGDFEDLKKRYDDLRSDFEVLKKGGDVRNRYTDGDFEDLKKKYDDLMTDFKVLKNGGKISSRYSDGDYEDLRGRYDDLRKDYEVLKGGVVRNRYTDADYEDLRKRHEALRKDFEVLKGGGKVANKYSDGDYEELKNRHDDLRKDYDDVRRDNDDFRRDNDDLRKKLEEAGKSERGDVSQSDIDLLKKDLENENRKNINLNFSNEDLKTKNDILGKRLKELENELEALRKINDDYKQNNNNTLKIPKSEYDLLHNKFNTLLSEFETNKNLDNKETIPKSEYDRLKRNMEDLQNRYDSLEYEFKRNKKNDEPGIPKNQFETLQEKFNRLNYSYNELLLTNRPGDFEGIELKNTANRTLKTQPNLEILELSSDEKENDKNAQIVIIKKQMNEVAKLDRDKMNDIKIRIDKIERKKTDKDMINEIDRINRMCKNIEKTLKKDNQNEMTILKIQLDILKKKIEKNEYTPEDYLEINNLQLEAINLQIEELGFHEKYENEEKLKNIESLVYDLDKIPKNGKLFNGKKIKEEFVKFENDLNFEKKNMKDVFKLQLENLKPIKQSSIDIFIKKCENDKKNLLHSLIKQIEELQKSADPEKNDQLENLKSDLKKLENKKFEDSKYDFENILDEVEELKEDAPFEDKIKYNILEMQLKGLINQEENNEKLIDALNKLENIENDTNEEPLKQKINDVYNKLESLNTTAPPVKQIAYRETVKSSPLPPPIEEEDEDEEKEDLEKELNRAFDHIQELQKQNEALKTELEGKKKEIITITKEIKTKETDTITKNNELNTKETKVIKLQAKERTKEWKLVLNSSQELAKKMKEMLEKVLDEKIHDNLDLGINGKTGLAYSEPIIIYLDKCKKYQKQINLILEENQGKDDRIRKLQKELKEAKNEKNLTELMDIFAESKKSTNYYVDLLRSARKEKYVNVKNTEIDSDDPNIYLQGIFENFNYHEEYYKEIKDLLDAKNKEIRRLESFENGIKTGKNKDHCQEDFLNIFEKNKKVNKELVIVANNLLGEEIHKEKKQEDPKTPQEALMSIYEEFSHSNSIIKEIKRNLEDLKEEKENLEQKLINLKKNNNNEELQNLENLFNSAKSVNAQSKDTLKIIVPDLIIKEMEINMTNKNPEMLKRGIENYNKSIKDDLLRMISNVEELNSELERLKEIEKQFKSGQQNDNSINDLRFLLKKNLKLNDNVKNCYKVIVKDDEPENLEFKVENEEDPESFIKAIKGSIKQSSGLIQKMESEAKDQKAEIERLHIFEKEILDGKNKKNALEDFKALEEKSKKNLKDLYHIMEKAGVDNKDNWQSTIFSPEEKPEEFLDSAHSNLNKWHNYNRDLEDYLNDLVDENKRLKKFEEDVKSGKNKNNVLDDLKKLFNDGKVINNGVNHSCEKLKKDKPKNSIDIDLDQENPDNLIEAISKYNDNTKKNIEELNDQINEKNKELKRLSDFEDDVKSGKIKLGAVEDLKKICDNKKIEAKKIKRLLEAVNPEESKKDDFKDFDASSPKTSEDFIQEIDDLENYEKGKLEKLDLLLNNTLEEKNKEIDKLNKMMDDIKSGKNKDFALEDYKRMCENELILHKKINGVYKLLKDSDSPDLIEIELNEDPETVLNAFKKYNENNNKMIGELTEEADKKSKNLKRLIQFEDDVKSGKIKLGAENDLKKIWEDKKKKAKKIKQLLEGIDPDEKNKNDFGFDSNSPESPQDHLKEIDELENYENKKLNNLEIILDKTLKEKDSELEKLRKFKEDVQSGKNKNNSVEDFKNMFLKEQTLHLELHSSYELLKKQKSPNFVEENITEENSSNYLNSFEKYNESSKKMISELKEEMDKKNKELARLLEFENNVKTGKIKLGATEDLKLIYNNKKLANKKIKILLEAIDPSEKQNKDFVFDNNNPENSEEYIKEIDSLEKYEKLKMQKLEGILENEIEDNKKKSEELEKLRKFKEDVEKGINKDGVISDFAAIYDQNFIVTQQNKEILELIDPEDKQWNPFPHKKETYKTSEEYIKMINEFHDYQKKTILAIKNKYNLQKNKFDLEKEKLNENFEKQKKELDRLNQFEQDVLSGKNKIGANKDLKSIYETELKNSRNMKTIIEKLFEEEKSKPFQFENQKPEVPEHYIKYISEMNIYQYESMDKIKVKLDSSGLSSKKEMEEKEKEIAELKKFKEDTHSGKIKIGALEDLKRIHEHALNHARNLKKGFRLTENPDEEYEKFIFEDKTPDSPEAYIQNIEDMNVFMKDYIVKLKKRIDDMMDELRELRSLNNKNKLKLTETETEKNKLKTANETSQSAILTLKQKITEIEASLTLQANKAVSSSSLQTLLKSSMQARSELNHITTLVSKLETTDEFNYNITEESPQTLITYITENTSKINQQINDLKPLLKKNTSTDSMLVLGILNELESYKEAYLEVYGNIIDDDVEDTSEVEMSEAKGSEQIVKFIYQDLEFLNSNVEEFQDDVEGKVNKLVEARNKILQQRDKYHESCDDLTRENNKKTALIGKLQVKLYMAMTVLDNLEKMKK